MRPLIKVAELLIPDHSCVDVSALNSQASQVPALKKVPGDGWNGVHQWPPPATEASASLKAPDPTWRIVHRRTIQSVEKIKDDDNFAILYSYLKTFVVLAQASLVTEIVLQLL